LFAGIQNSKNYFRAASEKSLTFKNLLQNVRAKGKSKAVSYSLGCPCSSWLIATSSVEPVFFQL
jgi:hypothetical protein